MAQLPSLSLASPPVAGGNSSAQDPSEGDPAPSHFESLASPAVATSLSDSAPNASNAAPEFFDNAASNQPVPLEVLESVASGPHSLSALFFLGTKYNSALERCSKECVPRYEELKKQCARERAERRRVHNELIELRGNIRVFCRCRPLNAEEVEQGNSAVVHIDPAFETDLHVISGDGAKKAFKFDRVFGPTDNQESVFAETLPVVSSALDGFNVCIFAYGQTGTGKTFTMEGTPENRGVNYRALEELFRIAQERSSSMAYEFSVSMLEVYNEKIRDLLVEGPELQSKKLDVKQTIDGTQEVQGLFEAQVCTIDEVWDILQTGARNRSVGSTFANELSSRSHSLVRVTMVSTDLLNGQRTRSNLWLVDLAGSERVLKTQVEGERLKESQFINKSLSALGDVISALASKSAHVPYRNSKLTHLLQSSLGGDCKTLMFVQISPSDDDVGETLSSLNFATRVRGVEHAPARRQVEPAENAKLKQMTEKLQQEEKEKVKLNERLQLMDIKYASREHIIRTLQDKVKDAEQACRNYQLRIKDLEIQLVEGKRSVRDAGAVMKPPRVPLKQRPPLGKITNNSMAFAPRKEYVSRLPVLREKENNPVVVVDKTAGKARRVSLTPVVRHPQLTKRRPSLVSIPSAQDLCSSKKTDTNQQPALLLPRRRSVATFSSTFSSIPSMPKLTDAGTSDNVGRSRNSEASNTMSNLHAVLALYKSRLTMASSPQQKLRLMSSLETPRKVGDSLQPPGKLCFSVQKRILLSPMQAKHNVRPGAYNQASASNSGRLVRFPTMNRRKSVF